MSSWLGVEVGEPVTCHQKSKLVNLIKPYYFSHSYLPYLPSFLSRVPSSSGLWGHFGEEIHKHWRRTILSLSNPCGSVTLVDGMSVALKYVPVGVTVPFVQEPESCDLVQSCSSRGKRDYRDTGNLLRY